MKKFLSAVVIAAALGLSFDAFAHGTAMAWYGGHITEVADTYRVEFAIRDGGVRVWVRDHDDKAVAASGKVTALINGAKSELALVADGEGLQAPAAIKSADKVTAILSLSVGGKAVSARFSQDAVTVPALAGSAQAGKAAFEKVCATCHGQALRGSDRAPPLLHPFYGPQSGHGDDAIIAAATQGAKAHMWKFGDMPKPEGLAPGQEQDVVAYIRAMQAANGLGAAASPPAAMPMDHSDHMKH